jgi:hypothetical protein
MTTVRDNLCHILRLFLIDGLAMFTKVKLYRQKYAMRASQKRPIEHTILAVAPVLASSPREALPSFKIVHLKSVHQHQNALLSMPIGLNLQ